MPLRLLYVTEYFHPFEIGGAELSTEEHAANLASAGHEVTILTPNYGAEEEETHRGVRIVRMPFPARLGVGEAARPILFQNPLFYAYLAWWCWRIARRRRIQVIHAQNSFSVVGAYLGSGLAGCGFAVTLRDTMHLCSAGGICLHDRDLPPFRCSISQYRDCFEIFERTYAPGSTSLGRFRARTRNLLEIVDVKMRQWALERADLTLAVSDSMGQIYQAAGLVRSRPITVHNPPIDAPNIAPSHEVRAKHKIPPDAPVVLYAGKLSYGKGTDILLEVVPEVRRVVPAAQFVLAGRTNPLIPIAEGSGVIATGPLPHLEILALYREADIVVLPSVWKEPFPRVILEAMAAECPVVATRTGGIPDLVEDGVTGILVPPRDKTELAAALIHLLREPETRLRLGKAGKDRLARLFSPERILRDLESAYQERLVGLTEPHGRQPSESR